MNESDSLQVQKWSERVVELINFRESLINYLRDRMNAVAPNLQALIGEIVGSKLIAHAGGLTNLSKYPASTIQILGAEKALFRALKSRKNTPKYGLIYNASIVGVAKNAFKGKISRSLANKCALCVRFDALGESVDGTMGTKNKVYLEERLKLLESGGSVIKKQAFGSGGQQASASIGDKRSYNENSDFKQNKRAKN